MILFNTEGKSGVKKLDKRQKTRTGISIVIQVAENSVYLKRKSEYHMHN